MNGKWDGIRGQVIHRRRQVFIWSRGEELVSEKYPELAQAAAMLPDGTVLDGEILPWREGRPLPFSELQRRIGRKTVGKKLLKEAPTAFLAYDVLEFDGEDQRPKALSQRRKILSRMLSNPRNNQITAVNTMISCDATDGWPIDGLFDPPSANTKG